MILPIHKMYVAENSIHAKGNITREQADIHRRIMIARRKIRKHRSGPKRDKLDGALKYEVEHLIFDDSMSYRQTAKHLKEKHGLKVSASYLCEIMQEWGLARV